MKAITRRGVSSWLLRATLVFGGSLVLAVLIWQAVRASGVPDPLGSGASKRAAVLDIGVLVFREGLESVLVIAAVVASLVGASGRYRRPIAAGIVVAIAATFVTWKVAVGVLDGLLGSVSALELQAATGLLAIVVLLIVMNWFFHKVYWTGWISLHTRRRKTLLSRADDDGRLPTAAWWGFAVLGFTSFYREGFEVVLFLQTYRLKLGEAPVLRGTAIGVLLTCVVALLTFIANYKLPYRRMLVFTGVMLGFVLLVMVGEQAQEMQLAGWLTSTEWPWLATHLSPWTGVWLGLSPTIEGIAAQLLAGTLVLGSYLFVERQLRRDAVAARRSGLALPGQGAVVSR